MKSSHLVKVRLYKIAHTFYFSFYFFFFLFISREKDIKEINQSIADIPKKTNKMYDRMDMIILGSSALVVGYVFCFVT